MFQPTPELGWRWGIQDTGHLIRYAGDLGYAGICLDTHHWRRVDRSNYRLPDWRRLIPHLESIPLIHVSTGRVDLPIEEVDTMAELRRLADDSSDRSELEEMLTRLSSEGWSGTLVVEVPAVAVAHHLGTNQLLLDPEQLMAIHCRILRILKSIFT